MWNHLKWKKNATSKKSDERGQKIYDTYRIGQKSGNTLVTFERIKVESCN